MSLTGILDVLLDRASPVTPRCAEPSRPPAPGAGPQLDLTAPRGVRPFALAAVAARGRASGAGRHRDRPGGRGPGAALRCLLPPDARRRVPGLGDAAARAALARAATPSAGGWPCCAGSRTPTPTTRPHGPLQVVVAPVRAVLQPHGRRASATSSPVALQRRRRGRPRRRRRRRLAAAAYTRVDLVEKRGEFAVRGGILDVFPPTEEHPLRVEFWGDTVEEIRYFKVADQRVARGRRARAVGAAVPRAAADRRRARAGRRRWPSEHPALADLLDKIAEGIAVEGMESLAPVLVDDMELLLDVLPDGTHVVVLRPRAGPHPGRTTWSRPARSSSRRRWANAAAGGADARSTSGARHARTAASPTCATTRREPRHAVVDGHARSPPTTDAGADDDATVVDAGLRGAADGYRGDTARRARPTSRAGSPTAGASCCVTEGHGPAAARSSRCSRGEDIAARLDADLDATPEPRRRPRHCRRPRRRLRRRPAAARRAHRDRPDRPGGHRSTKDMRRMPSPAAQRRRPAPAASPATTSCTSSTASAATSRWCSAPSQGATREYLVIEYAPAKRGQPGDRLFVPTDQLDQVTRYVGGEAPDACTGSAAPTGRRPRAARRKAVKEIAAELIRLYSARMAAPGPRLRPGHPVAARARGRLPLRRDARPARAPSTRSRPTWRSRSRWTG